MKKVSIIAMTITLLILGSACATPPTATPIPTNTVPATRTSAPPTVTSAPPTNTPSPVPPTATSVPTVVATVPSSSSTSSILGSGPPSIPSDHAGRTQCLVCHATGVSGAPTPIPAIHSSVPDDPMICMGCHQQAK